MKQRNKNRKNLHHILDFIKEIQGLHQKDSIFSDNATRPAIENWFIKIGEAIKRLGEYFAKGYCKKYKNFRNDLAHKIEIPLDNLQNFIQDLNSLKNEVKAYLPQQKHQNPTAQNFEDFAKIGTKEERIRIVDALIDQVSNSKEGDKVAFPKSIETATYVKAIQEITNQKDLTEIAEAHDKIASEIVESTLDWLKNTAKKANRLPEISEEEYLLAQKKQESMQDFIKNFAELKNFLMIYFRKDFDLSFYESAFAKKEKLVSVKNNFFKTWEDLLAIKKSKAELELIDAERQEYCKELYQKIANFKKLKDLLTPFTKDLGRLWDLSEGVWKDIGFDVLEKYADILEKDKNLQELAELLGKYRKSEKEWEESYFEKTIFNPKWKAQHSAKSEYVGVHESDDIQNMLPNEIALLADKTTENVFFSKFAEKKLQTFEFQSRFLDFEKEQKQEKQLKEKESDKGPFVICVDTSGSMHGTPEYVAKVLCFAILKMAIEENRNCYLISFSTQIQTLDLAELPNSLEKIVKFLRLSFQGGTDATPALKHAIEMINTKSYQKADVIVISDFIMPTLDEKTKESIKKAKEQKSVFHSLTISNASNIDILNDFDYNWIYNTQNPNAIIDLIKDMKSTQ